jgi:hypothetical protein
VKKAAKKPAPHPGLPAAEECWYALRLCCCSWPPFVAGMNADERAEAARRCRETADALDALGRAEK